MIRFQIFFILMLFSAVALCGSNIGRIIPLTGIPVLHSEDEFKLTSPSVLKLNDQVSTGSGVSAKAVMTDESTINVQENSRISFRKAFIRLDRGNARFFFRKSDKKYKVFTPVFLVGVYGTDFELSVQDNGDSKVILHSGKIEVTALKGNRKSVFLQPEQSVHCTAEGLGMVKEVGQSEQKSSVHDLPRPEGEAEKHIRDLVSSGQGACYISAVRASKETENYDHYWLVKVNGYDTLNGKQLLFSGKQKGLISGLSPGFYDLTFMLNGCEYTFTQEIPDDATRPEIKVLLEKFKFEIKIGDLERTKAHLEFINHVRMFVTFGQTKRQLYFSSEHASFPGCTIGTTKGKTIYLYYPLNSGPPDRVTFIYDGKVETSAKSIELILDPKDPDYEVNF